MKFSRAAFQNIALLWVLAVAACGSVFASPIMYIFQGTSSGSVGARTFTDALFTIQAYGNTSNVSFIPANPITGQSSLFLILNLPSSIFISGIGSGNFTTSKQVFVTKNNVSQLPVVGIGDDIYGDIVDLDIDSSSLAAYDLKSPFGPVVDPTPFAISQFRNVDTTLGKITFSSARDVAFIAVAVPEQGSLVLFGITGFIVLSPNLFRAFRQKAN